MEKAQQRVEKKARQQVRAGQAGKDQVCSMPVCTTVILTIFNQACVSLHCRSGVLEKW
jgi:hypothetical protein